MIDYTYNDGGRAQAGYKGTTGDCICRAVCILTGRDYKEVYETIADFMSSKGRTKSANMYTYRRVQGKRSQASTKRRKVTTEQIVKLFGFKKVTLPKGELPTYTEAHERYGDCLATTTKHIVALKDGALQDIFDGREYMWMGDEEVVRERKARSVYVLEKKEQAKKDWPKVLQAINVTVELTPERRELIESLLSSSNKNVNEVLTYIMEKGFAAVQGE